MTMRAAGSPPEGVADARLVPDAETDDWIRALSADGAEREQAAVRLHELLLRAARAETRRRGGQLRISGPELDDLAYQAAADAVVAVLAKIGEFRGESRFTTWAYKFVIFEVSAKIGRHFWRHPTVPMGAEDWDRLPDRFGFDPARQAEWRDLFAAIVLNDVPLDTLAMELASNRNAIYKMLFDARRKLRAALAANGYLSDEC